MFLCYDSTYAAIEHMYVGEMFCFSIIHELEVNNIVKCTK